MFQDLVLRAKNNDPAAKEEIVIRLRPLIISLINRYYNKANEYEDLIQEGNLIVLESILSYDFNKGVYFLAYIKSKLGYHYLNKRRIRVEVSLNNKLGDGQEEIIDLVKDYGEGVPERIVRLEENVDLYKAYEELSKREKEVISLYYIKSLNMKSISKDLGLSYRTVVNTKANALKKMKKSLKSTIKYKKKT